LGTETKGTGRPAVLLTKNNERGLTGAVTAAQSTIASVEINPRDRRLVTDIILPLLGTAFGVMALVGIHTLELRYAADPSGRSLDAYTGAMLIFVLGTMSVGIVMRSRMTSAEALESTTNALASPD
jgi:uncharacterized membrane protein YqjE